MWDILGNLWDAGKELIKPAVEYVGGLLVEDDAAGKGSSKKSQGFAKRLAKSQQQTYAHLRQKALQDRLNVGLAPSNVTRKHAVSNPLQVAVQKQKQLSARVMQEVGSVIGFHMRENVMRKGFEGSVSVASLKDTDPEFKLGEFDADATKLTDVGKSNIAYSKVG